MDRGWDSATEVGKECWALSINRCPRSFPITEGVRATPHPYSWSQSDQHSKKFCPPPQTDGPAPSKNDSSLKQAKVALDSCIIMSKNDKSSLAGYWLYCPVLKTVSSLLTRWLATQFPNYHLGNCVASPNREQTTVWALSSPYPVSAFGQYSQYPVRESFGSTHTIWGGLPSQ